MVDWKRILSTGLLLVSAIPVFSQETPAEQASFKLVEPTEQSRPYRTEYTLDVSGELSERSPGSETKTFALKSQARLEYTERRLPPSGQNASALRAIRYFDKHETDVTVEKRETELRLPPGNRLFVVEGRDSELFYYPPEKLLSAQLLEQLRIPFDSVSAWGLLPRNEVKVGDTWIPDTWAQQLVTGVEAVLKSDFVCTLEKVEKQIASVSFEGTLEGGRYGGESKLEFTGVYEFDLSEKFIRELHLTLKDKSTISPVSPGLDIVAKIRFTRKPVESHPQLPDKLIESIPLDASRIRLLLHFDSTWGTRFLHTRNWHVIPGKFVILRLIDNGSLITQGTMMGLSKAAPGEHISEKQFQADIRKSLGERLTEIASAEQIPTNDGRFLYRVTALGRANDRDMKWIYYLCAHPDGRQVSFVFSTEQKLAEQLADRELKLITTVTWPEGKSPERAE